MKRSQKLTLGFISFLPAIYVVVFLVIIFIPNIDIFNDIIDLSLYACALLIVGLIIYYHIFISKSNEIPVDSKRRIILRLYLGNYGCFPSYWYKYIWKNSTNKITNQLA